MGKNLTLLLAVILISSCGSKESTYRGSTANPSVYVPVSGSLAECTRVMSSGLNINAQISTHYTYGSMDKNIVQMNISQAPSELLSQDGYVLRFYRWKELTEGQMQVNNIPTPFYFKHKVTGSILGSQYMTDLSKSTVQSLITNNNLSNLNITLNNFFSYYYVVLTSVDFQWQAIRIAYYNTASGSNMISSADSLLPPYFADPNVYIQNTSSSRLQSLHPLFTLRGSGGSQTDYKQLCDNICYEFFGTIRNPASEQHSAWSKISSYFNGIWNSVRSFLSDFLGL